METRIPDRPVTDWSALKGGVSDGEKGKPGTGQISRIDIKRGKLDQPIGVAGMRFFSLNGGMSLKCRGSLCESFWPWPSSLAAFLTVVKKRSLFASLHNVNCA